MNRGLALNLDIIKLQTLEEKVERLENEMRLLRDCCDFIRRDTTSRPAQPAVLPPLPATPPPRSAPSSMEFVTPLDLRMWKKVPGGWYNFHTDEFRPDLSQTNSNQSDSNQQQQYSNQQQQPPRKRARIEGKEGNRGGKRSRRRRRKVNNKSRRR